MWFTLSCQRRGRARDGEMRAATLSLLLSQLSHLDDSPPLSCSLCLTLHPHPPILPPPTLFFPAVTSAEWQHGCPGYRIILGEVFLRGLLFYFFFLFFFISPVHFCHKLRTSHTRAMIMWLRTFRGQRFTRNTSVCVCACACECMCVVVYARVTGHTFTCLVPFIVCSLFRFRTQCCQSLKTAMRTLS